MSDETSYPAGWYPDVNAPGTDRYYDGATWTAHTRPTVPAAPVVAATNPTPGSSTQTPKRRWYARKAIVIPAAVVVGIFAISSIAAAVNGSGSGSTPSTDEPAAAAQSDKPTHAPVMATVPNVVGKTGADAIAALEVAHLKADTGSGDLTMPVTAQDVAAASQVEEGSVVTLTLQAKPVYTVAQESAMRSATSYLSLKGFSRAGLLDQLTSEYGEGFAAADAEFAVTEIEKTHQVDWNEEAVESAKSYLELKGFSRQGLFEQLTSAYGEQFTAAQANYALDKVGLH